VSVAFVLPDDFSEVINVTYNNKFKLQNKQYNDVFEDLNNYKGSMAQRSRSRSLYDNPVRLNPFYTIKDFTYMLIYNLNRTGEQIWMRYVKVPAEMTTLVGCSFDNDLYAKTTIPYLAVAEMLYNRGEEDRAGQLYAFALSQVKEMYTYYNN